MPHRDVTEELESLLDERVLVLDGATGTQIQALELDEADIRGERFADHHKELKNFADILCLTRPDDMTAIHCRYLEAGADIIETNTLAQVRSAWRNSSCHWNWSMISTLLLSPVQDRRATSLRR